MHEKHACPLTFALTKIGKHKWLQYESNLCIKVSIQSDLKLIHKFEFYFLHNHRHLWKTVWRLKIFRDYSPRVIWLKYCITSLQFNVDFLIVCNSYNLVQVPIYHSALILDQYLGMTIGFPFICSASAIL